MTKFRDTILKQLGSMYDSNGNGINPYTVNVITFSGHGISYNNDSVAVIPENSNDGNGYARFINMSGMARKFAQKNYTINIFILNMCQEILKPDVLKKS
jgi:hypothetical protein